MRFRQGLMTVVLGSALSAVAQQPAPTGPGEDHDVLFFNYTAAAPAAEALQEKMSAGAPVGAAIDRRFMFISAAGFGAGEAIKGAPYSAEAITEIVQTLADGNRIVRKMSAMIYRDSEGRIRKDQTLGAVGPWVATPDAGDDLPQLSFITDPVAQVQYVLDHKERAARQMPLPPGGAGMASAISATPGMPVPTVLPFLRSGPPAVEWEEHFDVEVASPQGNAGARVFTKKLGVTSEDASDNSRTESLGTQSIEGVEAEGTRTTVTIPAGAIGNELPIEIVSERWFAPSLQVVVLSTNSDPRMGKTTYRLAGLSRNEPMRSLFEVPAGYTIVQPPTVSADGFAECAAAGNPVTESFPRQCRTAEGKTYIEPPAPGSGLRRFTAPLPPPR
jgi:hypothetical protein